MIAYLSGKVLHHISDGILLLVDNIGYEVLITPQNLEKIFGKKDKNISLYIYYYQTERQPKPVLIGFETFEEKEFFQAFITVDAIGPMKALKAMTIPISKIAIAIAKKDVNVLTSLNGIGKRTAEKIIATLHGKTERFIATIDMKEDTTLDELDEKMSDVGKQVADVLVEQLGHSYPSAKRMIKEAFERNKNISAPEELLDQIYRENDKYE